jgi:cobalamin biosynthesis Mg chelatase CobN
MKNLLLIIISLLLFSCGARKSKKSKIETVKQTELATDAATKTETTIATKTETQALTEATNESEKLEPIDSSKPIIKTQSTKDGTTTTTWQNAKVDRTSTSRKEVVKEIKTDKSKVIKHSKSKALLKIKENTENIKKETQRESYSIWWLLLLIIPILYFYIKYR